MQREFQAPPSIQPHEQPPNPLPINILELFLAMAFRTRRIFHPDKVKVMQKNGTTICSLGILPRDCQPWNWPHWTVISQEQLWDMTSPLEGETSAPTPGRHSLHRKLLSYLPWGTKRKLRLMQTSKTSGLRATSGVFSRVLHSCCYRFVTEPTFNY